MPTAASEGLGEVVICGRPACRASVDAIVLAWQGVRLPPLPAACSAARVPAPRGCRDGSFRIAPERLAGLTMPLLGLPAGMNSLTGIGDRQGFRKFCGGFVAAAAPASTQPDTTAVARPTSPSGSRNAADGSRDHFP